MEKKNTNMDTEAQLLPNDPVLEIVARCGTIGDAIRCAASSKSLRRGILDAPFLRHLRVFLNNGSREYGDGGGRPFFIPTLLLGLYYQSARDPRLQPSFLPASDGATKEALAALPPPPNRDGGVLKFGPYLPVASCRSLLLLRRRCNSSAKEHPIDRHSPQPIELSVCNPTTRERLVLPPHHVQDMSHVLLDVDLFVAPSTSLSFKLLIAELSEDNPSTLHVQIFSSDSEQGRGGWGPALACPITSRFDESRFILGSYVGRRSRPVVLGDTVCWLCNSSLGDRVLTWRWCGGVARAACIDNPPPGYSLGRSEKCLAVLPSTSPADAGGSHALLGMIIIENCEIQVWACQKRGGGSARDWKLWHLIKEVAVPRPMDLRSAELLWFCEGSGTLFLRPRYAISLTLFSVDMSSLPFSSMEVSKLDAREWKLDPEDEFCPYEVDMLSHMQLMMKKL